MANRSPLTQEEKEQIAQGKLHGQTLDNLAHKLRCSLACVRKWWREFRDHGLQGLRARRRGRGAAGPLSQFDPRVRHKALTLKRKHRRWGPNRVLIALRHAAHLKGLRLPSRSQLAVFFKIRCPECVARYQHRPPPATRPPQVTGVHELWYLDSQEGLALQNGEWATVCNLRDPVGAAILASQAFVVTTTRHWRKLHWTEVRQVLRHAFAEWKTLPDGVQTDKELRLAGAPQGDFPSPLTLWLVGLGVAHRLIRPGHPTDQAEIERTHRTLDDLALDETALRNVASLQHALDRERWVYNHEFPCRASDCAGQPPLVAHPELLQPRRRYQPELELVLFDSQRVYNYLATFHFKRKVSTTGRVSLGRQFYSLGRRHAHQTVQVHLDPVRVEWIFTSESGEELARRAAKNIGVQDLTGLDPSPTPPALPVQLTLPCFVA